MKKIENKDCLVAFGKFIAAEREKQEIYQKDIAAKIGISQVYYSYIERGERTVDLVLALKICEALGIDMRDFISNYM